MSDLTPHTHLEHHILEMVAVQWDGTNDHAVKITGELQRELQMRDAELVSANAHAGTRDGVYVDLRFRRNADGHSPQVRLNPLHWLVLHYHEQRLYDVWTVEPERGEQMFRRTRPVVVLHPRRGEIDAGS